VTVSRHSGFDFFTPDAGTTQALFCVACLQNMDVQRNVDYRGGNSITGPSDGPSRKIDKFTCPNAGQDWHDQVIAIRRLQRDTPSQTFVDLVEVEIQQIIKTRRPTKQNWMP